MPFQLPCALTSAFTDHIVCIVFNREDPEHRLKARWVIRTLIKECAERGWGEYRTHLALMDQIANTYNFNQNALMKLNETIKNALDPNGILAPGKNGVWPKSYDKKKWVLDEKMDIQIPHSNGKA